VPAGLDRLLVEAQPDRDEGGGGAELSGVPAIALLLRLDRLLVEVGERLTAFATVDRLADAVEVENIPRRDRLGGRRTVPLVAESEPAPPLRLGSAARRCEKDPGGECGHDESTRARHA